MAQTTARQLTSTRSLTLTKSPPLLQHPTVLTSSPAHKRPCLGQAAHHCSTRALPSSAQYHSQRDSHVVNRSVAVEAPPATALEVQADPLKVDWLDQWYPVVFIKDVDKSIPYRFVLMNTPLVIWWDVNANAFRVFKDICPHRLVPLSEGRITPDGLLQCGYHGWAFSGEGKCEVIPQDQKPGTARACATAYPCAVRQGLLFIKPVALPSAMSGADLAAAVQDEDRIPIVPELEEEGWAAQDIWRDLPLDWATLIENVLDSSHVPFTHHISMSNRNVIGDYNMKLDAPPNKLGFSGSWATGPRAGQLGPQTTIFKPPCYMKHRIDAKGYSSLTVVYAIPTSPGKCRLINRNVVKFHGNSLPAKVVKLWPGWWSHLSAHVLLEDDQIFLHTGEEEFVKQRAQGDSASRTYYMPSQADTYIIALHNWIDKFGGGGPFGPATQEFISSMGPRLSKEQLLDRYSQHTAKCLTCQKGLQQVRSARAVAAVAAGAAALFATFCAAVAVAGLGAPASASSATAVVAGSNLLATVGRTALAVAAFVAGNTDPVGQMLRAVAWGVAAVLARMFVARCDQEESKFFKGVYPPPRNGDKK